MFDVFLEVVRAGTICSILIILWRLGRKTGIPWESGLVCILTGLGLIFFGAILDITDSFPSLNTFVITGSTPYQSLLENVGGYALGFVFLAVGCWKWMPAAATLGRTEVALRESESRQKELVEAASVIVASCTPEGNILSVNGNVDGILGYTAEEFIGLNLMDLVHPDDLHVPQENLRKKLEGETDRTGPYQVRVLGKNGRCAWLEVNSWMTKKAEGTMVIHATARDVTHRKEAEAEIESGRHSFTSIVENSPDGVLVLDLDGKVLYGNQACSELFGLDREDIPGSVFGKPSSIGCVDEVCLIRSDKPPAIAEMRVANTLWESKPAYLAMLRDITEHRHALEAARKSEETMRLFIESSPIGINLIRNGRCTFVNSAFARIFGYCNPNEMVGMAVEELYVAQDRSAVRRDHSIGGDSRTSSHFFERRGLRKDGQVVEVSVRLKALEFEEEQALLGFVVDVSEKKALRSQFLQAQKMEAIGTLSGGIAHDFNNLLTVISGYSELLLEDTNEDDPIFDGLDKIATAAKKGSELVQRLLTSSKRAESRPQPLNLNQEVDQVAKLLSRTIPRMIQIELDLAEELWTVNADPGQIEQILMNLAVNARDAMPDGGKLTIRTANVVLDEDFIRRNLGSKPGEYVQLTVSDTGHGMDKDVMEHIFEPFFTTKVPGKGTGLGLATVYGIVKQHDGYVACSSEPGKGTTFSIYLHVTHAESVQEEIRPSLKAMGGSETILLVEDEEVLLDLGTKILTRAGYTVLKALDGVEALKVYEEHRDRIRLVILDLIMPRMGGLQFLKVLLETDPEARVLLASGYSSTGEIKDPKKFGAKGFIRKPYEAGTLMTAIRQALDGDG